jgi:uncharacterized DUF497 family protein
MKKLIFEWDDKKNASNKRKHGVSFEDAQTEFFTKTPLNLMIQTIPSKKKGSSF